MAIELLIANNQTGQVWDMTPSVQSVTWTTNRTGSPASLSFSAILGSVNFSNGDTVRFSEDGQVSFFGWIFTISRDRWGVVEVTCYDRLRYLKASASYAFYAQTAGEIITQIAEDFQITTGSIADTGFPIPSLIKQEQTCLDIIGAAVEQTLLNTGTLYIFYDDGTGLALQEAASLVSNVVIGDSSLMTEYTLKQDIDQQTYNSVKLARPNEETGRTDIFVAEDTETINQWGFLQLYQSVDGAVNDAQVQAQAEATLSYYNRELNSFQFDSLGVPGLRAGQLVLINIGALGLSQYVLLDKVTHTYTNNDHTMSIETLPL